MPGIPPDIDVRINSRRLPPKARKDVREVVVEEAIDVFSMFTIVLRNWDDARQDVTWSDDSLFAVGNEVEVFLGYVDDLHSVMLGEITGLEPTFEAGQTPLLTVRGYDHRHRLTRRRAPRSFLNMTDRAIAERLATDAGLRFQAGREMGAALRYVAQRNETDWEFLRRRASLIEYEVFVRDKTLHFRPPAHREEASMTLTVGKDVAAFTPRLSILGQVDEVTVRAWDDMRKEVIESTARAGDREGTGGEMSGPRAAQRAAGRASTSVVDLPVRAGAEAAQVASGRLDSAAFGYVQGEVVCGGLPRLRAGTVVALEGAGTRFSGRYYVTNVTHSVSPEQGYETRATVQRNSARRDSA